MKGATPKELQQLILSVGTHRNERPLSPVEVSDLLARSIAAGASRSECGEALNVGSTQIATFLRLQKLAPELRHLASWGSKEGGIAFSSLAQLASMGASDQRVVATAILENGLTWKEVVQIAQIWERSEGSIHDAISKVLALRPEIEVRHIVIGSVRSRDLRSTLSTLSQRERDELLDAALRSIGQGADMSGRLGADVFTLVQEGKSSSVRDADELEDLLNEKLRSLVRK